MFVKIVLASSVFASCLPIPSGDIKDPQTWGDLFLDKYEDERRQAVEVIEPGPAPLEEPRTVLLITGVTIPAEWFDPIVARLERDGFKPVVYEPPDLLSGDLFENAELLGDVIERVRAESGEDKIDILAECTGGLIARYYIQSLGGDQYVRRMVTFISPQHGVDKAPIAYDLVGWPALDDLSPGSEFLRAVNDAPLPDNVAFTSIYTCTDEYIQPYETSYIPGATNIELCDGFIGHFQFFYDPEIYGIMHASLTAPVEEEPTEEADPTPEPDEDVASEGGGCDAGGGGAAGTAFVAGLALLLARSRRRA